MGKLQQVARSVIAGILLMRSMQMMQSCRIKEDFSDCINEELLLYVKAIDVVTGTDITETGKLESARLYVFDHHKNHVRTYILSALQIVQREPVIINEYDPGGMLVSAWGNIGNEVILSKVNEGGTADELSVSLKPDLNQPGYDLGPNDFFFGTIDLKEKDHLQNAKEIVLTQKNARLHVTVRGLKDTNAENYYFKILNKYNEYDYRGVPVYQTTNRKEKGVFNSQDDLVSPEPWLLIHSANQKQATEKNSVWVYLYKEGPGSEEIVKTNRDTNGNYITLLSGKTTHVLIDLASGENGQFIVQIVITPWDEIHQWEMW